MTGLGPHLAGQAALPALTLAKVALLAAAARWSAASRAGLDVHHPARAPWGLLALGLGGLAAGHLSLGIEQLAWERPPLPFLSDAFIAPADAFLVVALLGFLRAYRSSGLLSGAGTRRAALVLGAAGFAIAAVVVATSLRLPTPGSVRATGAGYAILDLGLLVPLALLVRLAHRLQLAVVEA